MNAPPNRRDESPASAAAPTSSRPRVIPCLVRRRRDLRATSPTGARAPVTPVELVPIGAGGDRQRARQGDRVSVAPLVEGPPLIDHPTVPLDNNAAERALRGLVVGRKNHYGSRSRRGTEVAALFYSLIESAKLANVEPADFLRRAAETALAGAEPLLPHELARGST